MVLAAVLRLITGQSCPAAARFASSTALGNRSTRPVQNSGRHHHRDQVAAAQLDTLRRYDFERLNRTTHQLRH